ncbi:MAG: hypothetical protein ABL909_10560 [Sphingopyxis sp.]
MKLGTILYGVWAAGISSWFVYAAIMGTSPFAATTQHVRGGGIYGPTHK